MYDVIILAGGKGTRMGEDISKPLVLARDKEIIAWQLDNLYHNYTNLIGEVVVAVSFKADEVKEFLKNKYPDRNIKISFEETPLGTGGAIKQASNFTKTDKLIVFNVDDLSDLDLNEFKTETENRICVTNPILPFGLIEENNGYAQFIEKPKLENFWVSFGWYFLDRAEILERFPDCGSVEYDVFQTEIIKLKPYYHYGFWQPLNSKKELQNFNELELPEKLKF